MASIPGEVNSIFAAGSTPRSMESRRRLNSAGMDFVEALGSSADGQGAELRGAGEGARREKTRLGAKGRGRGFGTGKPQGEMVEFCGIQWEKIDNESLAHGTCSE